MGIPCELVSHCGDSQCWQIQTSRVFFYDVNCEQMHKSVCCWMLYVIFFLSSSLCFSPSFVSFICSLFTPLPSNPSTLSFIPLLYITAIFIRASHSTQNPGLIDLSAPTGFPYLRAVSVETHWSMSSAEAPLYTAQRTWTCTISKLFKWCLHWPTFRL